MSVAERVIVRRGVFLDSVALMVLSRDVEGADGVERASIVNATPLNVDLVERQGFRVQPRTESEREGQVGPDDLLIAIRARDEQALDAGLALVDERLRGGRGTVGTGGERPPPRSLASAARRHPELTLAVISVPGRHAAYDCARALDAGLDVFCFSSGPGVEHEVALKERAAAAGLLMMGPDCGTAILNGISVGFGNAVRSGPVGVVGASGTGIQAVVCRLDAAGVGISQAIGTGGRDLSGAVGGAMTLRAIEVLGGDPETEAIVVVGKAPEASVARRIGDALGDTGKPAVLAFPAFDGRVADGPAELAGSLEDASAAAARSVGAKLPAPRRRGSVEGVGGAIRGLFSGGTLRDEALGIIGAAGGRPETELEDAEAGRHVLVDLGDERFTQGRPHPMIDLSLRLELLDRESPTRPRSSPRRSRPPSSAAPVTSPWLRRCAGPKRTPRGSRTRSSDFTARGRS
jgi:FdrA protein